MGRWFRGCSAPTSINQEPSAAAVTQRPAAHRGNNLQVTMKYPQPSNHYLSSICVLPSGGWLENGRTAAPPAVRPGGSVAG